MHKSIVYNIDCMEYMKTLPDKAFDLAIVDPPYGIDAAKRDMGHGAKCKGSPDSTAVRLRKAKFSQGSGKLKGRALNQMSLDWDSAPPPQEYFDELFRVSKNQIIWGGELLQSSAHKGNRLLGQETTVGKLLAVGNGMDELQLSGQALQSVKFRRKERRSQDPPDTETGEAL